MLCVVLGNYPELYDFCTLTCCLRVHSGCTGTGGRVALGVHGRARRHFPDPAGHDPHTLASGRPGGEPDELYIGQGVYSTPPRCTRHVMPYFMFGGRKKVPNTEETSRYCVEFSHPYTKQFQKSKKAALSLRLEKMCRCCF